MGDEKTKRLPSCMIPVGLKPGNTFTVTVSKPTGEREIIHSNHVIDLTPVPPHLKLVTNAAICKTQILRESTEEVITPSFIIKPATFKYPSLNAVLKDLFCFAWGKDLEDCGRPTLGVRKNCKKLQK